MIFIKGSRKFLLPFLHLSFLFMEIGAVDM